MSPDCFVTYVPDRSRWSRDLFAVLIPIASFDQAPIRERLFSLELAIGVPALPEPYRLVIAVLALSSELTIRPPSAIWAVKHDSALMWRFTPSLRGLRCPLTVRRCSLRAV